MIAVIRRGEGRREGESKISKTQPVSGMKPTDQPASMDEDDERREGVGSRFNLSPMWRFPRKISHSWASQLQSACNIPFLLPWPLAHEYLSLKLLRGGYFL